MDDAEPARLTITVSFSPRAGEVDERVVELQPGASVRDALVASGLRDRHPAFDIFALPSGVWGKLCDPSRALRERDRVELYRPLTVDPKEARRLRDRATRKPRRDRRPAGDAAQAEVVEATG